jgi:hypothetical protein
MRFRQSATLGGLVISTGSGDGGTKATTDVPESREPEKENPSISDPLFTLNNEDPLF